MKQQPEKKKTFIMFPSVKDFMREQSGDVKKELNGIVFLLERDGTLSYPYAEKIQGEDLFAIRIIQAGTFVSFMFTDSKTGFMPFMVMSRKLRKYRNGKWPSREKH